MKGQMQWRSGSQQGDGEVIDVSTAGAAFKVPRTEAPRVGHNVELDVDLLDGVAWCVAHNATVLHKIPGRDGHCRIGVTFADHGP